MFKFIPKPRLMGADLQELTSKKLDRPITTYLPRSLSAIETWSFGLTGHVCWMVTAPDINAALGPKSIFIWLPGVIVSILLNLQVQRLGEHWSDMAGGTPNYAARLLNNFFPGLGGYVAIGYFVGWISVPVLHAIILTELVKTNLASVGLHCPEALLKLGFTCIAFIVAFNGTRALAILHLFFVVPAIIFLLALCFQGLEWLAFSPASPGLFPHQWSGLSFADWAKWFFIATYSVYSCETASSFVADSRQPSKTLGFLSFAAWLVPLVFLGGSWVLMRLATQPSIDTNLYVDLLAVANPIWGQLASFLVTLLISFAGLLSCATAVSNCPRILYQLALDGHLSPVFAVVSRRGVLGPALILTFLLSLLCLIWGDLSHVLVVTGTGYFVSIIGLHLGLWLCRGQAQVRWPWWSLSFFLVEVVTLIVGGLAWGWQDLVIGLLFPMGIMALDAACNRISWAPFHPSWWQERYRSQSRGKVQDFVRLQVVVLVLLICSAVTIGWIMSGKLDRTAGEPKADLLVILLVTLSFVGVAIACWTTLPQIAAIDEAREQVKNLFITAVDTVPDTVLVLDENGTICQTNAAAQELFQVNAQALIGYQLNELLTALSGIPAQWPSRSELTLKVPLELSPLTRLRKFKSQHKTYIIELARARRRSCLQRNVELTVSRKANRKLQEYVVILRDITKRKRTEAELQAYRNHLEQLVEERTNELNKVNQQLQQDIVERQQAQAQLLHNNLHDRLTGLPNQALFMERLKFALERVKQQKEYLFAVLFLDLDRFKVINDSLGHLVGNQLLIEIARKLETFVHSVDTVARFGGDEFTILLEDIQDISGAINVAQRIQQELTLPFNLNEHEVFTNMSIGIALSTPAYERPEHILRDADTAMYRAKSLGRSQYEVFNATMHSRAVVLLQLETDLRRAVQREEFRIYYQPIVSLVTGRIIGFEALLRWQHPKLDLVSPNEFISVAEETGMIVAIGEWVLRKACIQMQAWHARFPTTPPLTLNVNLSGKQLVQSELPEQLERVLQETHLDASSLKLEITESVLMDNTTSVTNILSQLIALNVELHMDDFGTGYSSLSYLHRLPISTLKVDRSFIEKIGTGSGDSAIVRAIITLAHSLNLAVTAEGIETQEQLAQLKELRCEYGQGYLFSRPLAVDKAEALIAASPQW